MHDAHDPLAPLGRLDLNLLRALDALLTSRNVTEAARRLGLTQSATSHALQRLRSALGDPLLVRGARGMIATPRAEALAGPLRAALRGLAQALDAPAPFDAATSTRAFRVASPDLFDALVLPTLLGRLAVSAPRVSVIVAPGPRELGARLESGELDAAIVPWLLGPDAAPLGPPLGPDLRRRRLLEDRFAPFVRVGHPAAGAGPLRPRAFAALAHVLVSPMGHGDGILEPLLAAHGVARHIALRVPHFASAIAVIQETDLVLVAPGSLAGRAARLGLTELAVTFRLPAHALELVWHPRFEGDAGHGWFRQELAACTSALDERRRRR